jgi:hypothetical protein
LSAFRWITVAALVVLVTAAVAGVGWAASARQPALVGKVTRVSVSRGFLVVNGKVIFVSRRTVIHLGGAGLAGIRAGRSVKVVVVRRNGRYRALDIRLVRAARLKTHAKAKPSFTG